MLCFDLTPYTIQPRQQRPVSVLRVETDRTTVWAAIGGAVVGALILTVLATFLPIEWTLPAVPISALLAVWLFARRSQHGMRLRNFQRVHRRIKTRIGKFYIGTEVLDLSIDRMCVLHSLHPIAPDSLLSPRWPSTRPKSL